MRIRFSIGKFFEAFPLRFRRMKTFHLILLILMLFCLTFALVLLFYARYYETEFWELNRQTLTLPHWHREHDGLKILILSDLHVRKDKKQIRRMEDIVRFCNSENPDLIFLLGDYMGNKGDDRNNASPEELTALLAPLNAKYGIYAVLGNHDWWYGGLRVRRMLENAGIHVLENSFETLEINGQKLNIAGLPDFVTRRKFFYDKPFVPPDNGEPTLLLAHSPESLLFAAFPYELMLSGHTHGGQIVFPGDGLFRIWNRFLNVPVNSGWIFDVDLGKNTGESIKVQKYGKVFVSRGLGTSVLPLRFNCAPEIVLMTLSASPVERTRIERSGSKN